jgi:hypothetical protein
MSDERRDDARDDLRELNGGEGQPRAGAEPERPALRRRWGLVVGAAVVLLIAAPRVIQHRDEGTPPDPEPSAPEQVVGDVAGDAAPGDAGDAGDDGSRAALAPRLETDAEGRPLLVWEPVAEAELYRVELFSSDLTRLTHVAVPRGTTLLLAPERIPGLADLGIVTHCRISALSRGRVTLTSPLTAIEP